MDSETVIVRKMPGIVSRLFPTIGPMLLISMGYIDPGKWSAVVEGGSRFGFDLVLLTLVFNCTAILCQYLAAYIGVATGKNLAQICREEYNKSTCIFLGVQAELSVILLDLTMILGIAHGLNALTGLSLLTCLLFTAIDAVLFPLLSTLLEKCKAEIFFVSTAGFILLCYVLGVLFSLPDVPLSINGLPTRLSGESAFILMSLLGANIVPHNFYIHSAIVQHWQQQGPPNISKSALCHDHFFAILCIFSGIYLVNYVVMNSAATVFHSAGILVLTSQDLLLLMDQVFGSPMALFFLFLVIFISSHITALTWNLGGQVVLHNLFQMDLPVWLHRATIRILAIVLALYYTWNLGAEGIYQLLVFTQVILAMLLPSSVVPLFRVAASGSIMGAFKISQFLEFLALISFIGMLGLNIIFVVEMLFDNSEWVGNLGWDMGSGMAFPYVVLLFTACASLVLMLWLAATPLKSATFRSEARTGHSDIQRTLHEQFAEGEENDISEIRSHGAGDENDTNDIRTLPVADEPSLENFVGSCTDKSVMEIDFDLPETILDSDQEPHLPAIEDNLTTGPHLPAVEENLITGKSSLTQHLEDLPSTVDLAPVESVVDKGVDGLLDAGTILKFESVDSIGKNMGVEGDPQTEKDDDEVDSWETEEPSRGTSGSGPTLTSEGSESFKSLYGKSDEGGNGNGSLSRLCGLGRAARRQLSAILDEFWGQLYDFHGNATQEGKAKKLDLLFRLDLKLAGSSLKVDPAGMGPSGYFPLIQERGSVSSINSSINDYPKQQRMLSSVESSYGFQTRSTAQSTRMQFLDGYMQGSSHSLLDSSERRYSSLRLPPSSEPATVHGCQLSSYISKIATDRNTNSLNTLLYSPTPKSPTFVPVKYKDPLTSSLVQKSQSQISTVHSSGMHNNPMVSRTSRLQAEIPYYDPCSPGFDENVVGSPAYSKKYHSLPDISGLAVPYRASYLTDRSSQWNGPPGFGPSVGRSTYGQSFRSSTGSRSGIPLAFDELSPPKVYGDTFSLPPSMNPDTNSIWSRQPFEKLFDASGKTRVGDEVVGSKPSLVVSESVSYVDSESELLQSFRHCIMKLLKLEGCDWLFTLNGGVDEDLIDRVAASERFHCETEAREVNQVVPIVDSQYPFPDKKLGSMMNQDSGLAKFPLSSVSRCGEGCIWRADLIVSFGVWCIHRILDLSIMESRPELWGKYTYVLNRLQGILDPAFSKPRSPSPPCFCLQTPALHSRRSSPPLPNGQLPPAAKPARGKCTTASTLLDIIKDVEIAVSCRKGRTGTAAGDVAFPKGKENLASVLKRYKRRLSNKPVGNHDNLSRLYKVPMSTS